MSKHLARRIGARLSFVLALGAIVVPGLANATEQWVTDNIRSVYPLSDGSFVITFVNPQPICTNTATNQYFWVSPSHNGVNADGAKAMLATALTAFVSGKKIDLAFEAATSDCFVNRLAIKM
jgi:hypothetical protein